MLLKSKKLSFLLVFSFFILVIPFFIFVSSKYYQVSTQIAIAAKAARPIVAAIEEKIIRQSQLQEIAESTLLNNEGKYGVYVKNLKTGETYYYNKDKKFDAASFYKLWVLAVVMQKIDSGSLNKEETLSASKEFLDKILSLVPIALAEEDLKGDVIDDEKITLKTGDAIEKMITLSDNYSAQLLVSKSGSKSIVNFLKENNFSDSNYNQPPQTSPKDIADFYEKLYKNNLENKDVTDEMIDILKRQTINDRIPKYLPRNIEVAHKTGELYDSKHDGGIVFTDKGDYIIVVMSETDDTVKASDNIAKFSKRVFDYFNG